MRPNESPMVLNNFPAYLSSQSELFADYRLRRFWVLGLCGFFIHGVLDPFSTYLAVIVYGAGTEANPWLATYVEAGWESFLIIHLPLYLVFFGVLIGFTWLFSIGSESEKQQLYSFTIVVWLVIILWGGLVVANNLLALNQSF